MIKSQLNITFIISRQKLHDQDTTTTIEEEGLVSELNTVRVK